MTQATLIQTNNERAAYRVLNPSGFFVDDTLYTTDQNGDPAQLYYDGEPNEGLEPLNDLARERMQTFLAKQDELARQAFEKAGKPYTGRPKTLDGAYEVVKEIQVIMASKKDERVSERIDAPRPDIGLNAPNRGRGRPKGS